MEPSAAAVGAKSPVVSISSAPVVATAPLEVIDASVSASVVIDDSAPTTFTEPSLVEAGAGMLETVAIDPSAVAVELIVPSPSVVAWMVMLSAVATVAEPPIVA